MEGEPPRDPPPEGVPPKPTAQQFMRALSAAFTDWLWASINQPATKTQSGASLPSPPAATPPTSSDEEYRRARIDGARRSEKVVRRRLGLDPPLGPKPFWAQARDRVEQPVRKSLTDALKRLPNVPDWAYHAADTFPVIDVLTSLIAIVGLIAAGVLADAPWLQPVAIWTAVLALVVTGAHWRAKFLREAKQDRRSSAKANAVAILAFLVCGYPIIAPLVAHLHVNQKQVVSTTHAVSPPTHHAVKRAPVKVATAPKHPLSAQRSAAPSIVATPRAATVAPVRAPHKAIAKKQVVAKPAPATLAATAAPTLTAPVQVAPPTLALSLHIASVQTTVTPTPGGSILSSRVGLSNDGGGAFVKHVDGTLIGSGTTHVGEIRNLADRFASDPANLSRATTFILPGHQPISIVVNSEVVPPEMLAAYQSGAAYLYIDLLFYEKTATGFARAQEICFYKTATSDEFNFCPDEK